MVEELELLVDELIEMANELDMDTKVVDNHELSEEAKEYIKLLKSNLDDLSMKFKDLFVIP